MARSSRLSSVYDIGAAPYRKGQVLHSDFAAAGTISLSIFNAGRGADLFLGVLILNSCAILVGK